MLFILLTMAAFGIGITGNILNNNRERYMDKEIRREQTDKKDEEENEDAEVVWILIRVIIVIDAWILNQRCIK